MSSSPPAFKQWQFQNGIVELKAEEDSIYKYDDLEIRKDLDAKRWLQDVRISAIALIKMVMHARSGGNIEVMGLMYGKIKGREMIVLDAFELPVEGTETRVNAQAEGYEYMVAHTTKSKLIGRQENVIGWYHSHPGYGCWLSGIDVSTQMLNQQYQEPFLAIVIDPHRTMAAGKVEIGAFRTYPKSSTAAHPLANSSGSGRDSDSFQAIPMDKIEDFGVHSSQYYSLSISYFKSSFDVALLEKLWNRYWINTLSSSTILTNYSHTCRQIQDLASKIESVSVSPINQKPTTSGKDKAGSSADFKRKDERKSEPPAATQLERLANRSQHICNEANHALMHEMLKRTLFGRPQ